MEFQLLFGVGLALVVCLYFNGRFKYEQSKFLAERISSYKKMEVSLKGFCGVWISGEGVLFDFDKDGTVDVIDQEGFFDLIQPKGGAMTLDYEVIGSVIRFSSGGRAYINKMLSGGCVAFDLIEGGKLKLYFNSSEYSFTKLDVG